MLFWKTLNAERERERSRSKELAVVRRSFRARVRPSLLSVLSFCVDDSSGVNANKPDDVTARHGKAPRKHKTHPKRKQRLSVADFPAFPTSFPSFATEADGKIKDAVLPPPESAEAASQRRMEKQNEALQNKAKSMKRGFKRGVKRGSKHSVRSTVRALPDGVHIAQPVMEGWLWKKAQGLSIMGRSNWKKRWFTLHQGALRSVNISVHTLPAWPQNSPALALPFVLEGEKKHLYAPSGPNSTPHPQALALKPQRSSPLIATTSRTIDLTHTRSTYILTLSRPIEGIMIIILLGTQARCAKVRMPHVC